LFHFFRILFEGPHERWALTKAVRKDLYFFHRGSLEVILFPFRDDMSPTKMFLRRWSSMSFSCSIILSPTEFIGTSMFLKASRIVEIRQRFNLSPVLREECHPLWTINHFRVCLVRFNYRFCIGKILVILREKSIRNNIQLLNLFFIDLAHTQCLVNIDTLRVIYMRLPEIELPHMEMFIYSTMFTDKR
jgi:hypothetical protein